MQGHEAVVVKERKQSRSTNSAPQSATERAVIVASGVCPVCFGAVHKVWNKKSQRKSRQNPQSQHNGDLKRGENKINLPSSLCLFLHVEFQLFLVDHPALGINILQHKKEQKQGNPKRSRG